MFFSLKIPLQYSFKSLIHFYNCVFCINIYSEFLNPFYDEIFIGKKNEGSLIFHSLNRIYKVLKECIAVDLFLYQYNEIPDTYLNVIFKNCKFFCG